MSGDTRLWMYKAGEARLFDHPGQVPAGQGWQRFPVPESAAPPPQTPRVVLPEPGPDQELTDQEKLDRMSKQRLDAGRCRLRHPLRFRLDQGPAQTRDYRGTQ